MDQDELPDRDKFHGTIVPQSVGGDALGSLDEVGEHAARVVVDERDARLTDSTSIAVERM